MRRPAVLLLAIALPSLLADEAAKIRIGRIRSHMADNLVRLPNYTCTQTIERSFRPAKTRRFQLVDTLRLEVALVNGKELFAWPGSGKFDDREISEVIGSGASGNGNFGLHARAIFLGYNAQFEYVGEVEKEDLRVYQYSYHVPMRLSGYRVKAGSAEGIAGYNGRFEAETDSLDVVSLDVFANNEIPPHVPIQEASTKMRYRRMTIGEGSFLLPESSELAITDLRGNENRNVVHLSGCKQYGTESVISFADPPPVLEAPALPAAVPSVKPELGELPAGLSFEMELETGLAFPGAAIGDLIEGRVTSEAKKKGAVMIPKGAAVRGRLINFVPLAGARTPILGVTIRLMEIDLPGGRAEINGVVERILPLGMAGARLSVDNSGIIYIVSGNRRELARGSRIWWRLEPKPEKR
jgi:hypothetical protein